MNELDLFEYYWKNQNRFTIEYTSDNTCGSVPVFVVKEDYENQKSEVAGEFIIKEILKKNLS